MFEFLNKYFNNDFVKGKMEGFKMKIHNNKNNKFVNRNETNRSLTKITHHCAWCGDEITEAQANKYYGCCCKEHGEYELEADMLFSY